MNNVNINQFIKAAAHIRKLTISSIAAAGYGHIGGSMSICEVLAVLYEGVMNVDPGNPQKEDRDWLVLSKGHCGPALYSALAYKGYFDIELLNTLNQNGTSLPSHCDRLKTPGIDLSTGSLGQGISLGIGAALGNKMKGLDNYVYIIIGDGELQEGQVWEGIQFAAHRKLDNMILIVDCNKRQLDGYTNDICSTFDLGVKFSAFGFEVQKADGKDCGDIYRALMDSKQISKSIGKPTVVLLDTQKGQGCSFAEIASFNHYMVVTEAMAEEAICEVERRLQKALEKEQTDIEKEGQGR
ncbi:MAG: transketolase [Clostridiaceae bacterium]|nr:transketolase [Clostridiaceae bacterium]